MTPELGLVCITSDRSVRYHALTRTRYRSLPSGERRRVLRTLYLENLSSLERAIEYCTENSIKLYRVTSDLFPFADLKIGAQTLEELRPVLGKIGKRITEKRLRVVIHPDQFVVLNSQRPSVVSNSIKILELHSKSMDYLGLPRSPWAAIQIHGGKSNRANELIATIRSLSDSIRLRLALENDERAYSSDEISNQAGVPMVFDAHHHLVRERLNSYDHPSIERAFNAAASTWQPRSWQLVHISNGRDSLTDQRHSDFVTRIPKCFLQAPWIEVEAKLKEQAIMKLRPLLDHQFKTGKGD